MSRRIEEQAREAALAFRTQHGLGVQPIGDLISMIEQTTGHDVAIISADTDSHGLSMRDPATGRVYIAVAATPHPMRQRSTLAHELAHVIFEDWEGHDRDGERPMQEIRADAFARHLLAPSSGVQQTTERAAGDPSGHLSDVVQRYLVSPAIAAIVLADCGLISAETKTDLMVLTTYQVAARNGWLDQYRSLQDASNRQRAPQSLLRRATAAYSEGLIGLPIIAALRGLPLATVQAEFDDLGITPQPADPTAFELDELPAVEVDLTGLAGDEPDR